MPDEELPAGDETSISIIPKDQWGNVLVYDDELFSEVKDSLKYFYKEESKCPNCAFVQGNG
jgi:cytochrome c